VTDFPAGAENFLWARVLQICRFLFLIAFAPGLQAANGTLESGFHQPPKEARPLVFWHWINGNITKDGIRCDLEDMRRVGIAGVILVDVSVKTPPGPVRFGSPAWNDHLNYAMETAGELGLDFIISNCPGWALAGGPWVSVEDSMKKLVWTETTVKGPVKFQEHLAQGSARPVHARAASEPGLDFYRDVAVLAVPESPGEKVAPQWSASAGSGNLAALADGDPSTEVDLTKTKIKGALELAAHFPSAVDQSSLEILFPDDLPGKQSVAAAGRVEVSDDGKTFRGVRDFAFDGQFKNGRPVVTVAFPPIKASHFRVIFTRINPARFREITWHDAPRLENIAAKSAAAGVPSVFPAIPPSAEGTISLDRVVNLSASLASDGTLSWDVPEGSWTIYRFGYAATNAINHPAQPEGEGLEVDKMDAAAVARHFQASLGAIIEHLSPVAKKALVGVEMDSWEAGPQNWTKDFPAEFARRRGYEVIPYLPVIAGRVLASVADSEAFLADFRRTCDDLIAENFFGGMRRLAHEHGLQLYAEPYNGLFNQARCASNVDVIMGEYWMEGHWHDLPGLASFVHTSGRTILAAEALTAGPESGLWANTPRLFKPVSDRAFAAGMNRSILHSYVHQPRSDIGPGFTLRYHGSMFGRLNTWWGQAGPWLDYLARSQFLLQQGRTVADVLMLRHGDIDPGVEDVFPPVPAGYLSDQIAPENFLETKGAAGKIILPNGAVCRLLLLPKLWIADIRVLEHLQSLVQAGVPVIGPPPVMGAGMKCLHENAGAWHRLVSVLWNGDRKPPVRQDISPEEVLQAQRVFPDLRITDGEDVLWAHRVVSGDEIYFLSNPGKKTARLVADFRIEDRQPEIWDAVSGECLQAAAFTARDGRMVLPMTLGPAESRFVLFRQPLPAKNLSGLTREDGSPAMLGKDYDPAPDGVVFLSQGKYRVRFASGREAFFNADEPRVILLEGPWKVTFQPPFGKEFARDFPALSSWSQSDDPEVRYFSGTAIYRKSFAVAAGEQGADACFLELGMVRDIASVSVNGQPAGTAWTHPWRLDITKFVRPGENTLEIAVSNTWVNRLVGDEQLSPDTDYVLAGEEAKRNNGMLKKFPSWWSDPLAMRQRQRRTFTTWRHYDDKTPLVDSGLMGPVQITFFPQAKFSAGQW